MEHKPLSNDTPTWGVKSTKLDGAEMDILNIGVLNYRANIKFDT